MDYNSTLLIILIWGCAGSLLFAAGVCTGLYVARWSIGRPVQLPEPKVVLPEPKGRRMEQKTEVHL